MQTEIRTIPLSNLVLSDTPMQVERRKERTKEEISELAETIARVGLIHPIIVRPDPIADVRKSGNGAPLYEIIAGEGRYLAAKVAGLEEIQATVRELTDEQAEEVQLIENLQRKDLNELVEAEGYASLIQRGHTAEEIAERVGKSKRTVYTRLQLLKLEPAARTAFRDGKVSASIALLIARIPVEELQKKALDEVLDDGYEPMSYREASEHIQRNYMLRLKEAPFPVGDLTLVAGAGACATCPKNTAMQRELFADVEKASAGVCTDPVCFAAKRDAWGKQQLAKAQASGQNVIAGAQAKKIAKSEYSLGGNFVRLTDRCHVDPKYRTYGEIIGKKVQPTLLQMPKTGEVIEVVNQADVKDLLPKRSGSNDYAAQQRVADKKRQAELAYRAELLRRIDADILKPEPAEDLRLACEAMFDRLHHDGKVRLFKVMGWPVKERKDKYRGTVKEHDTAAVLNQHHTESDLWHLLRTLAVAGDLEVYDSSKKRDDRLHRLAKRLGLNAKKIEAELAAAAKAKAKPPAKASKKKAARKAK